MQIFPSHKPKQMELVYQKGKSDCGVACIAMLADILYEKASEIVKKLCKKILKGGMFPDQVLNILDELNLIFEEKEVLPNNRALVAVRWKDKNFTGHYIVWDNKRKQFLDPLHGVFGIKELNKYAVIEGIWKIYRRKK